jgi:hypothetical protein
MACLSVQVSPTLLRPSGDPRGTPPLYEPHDQRSEYEQRVRDSEGSLSRTVYARCSQYA